MKTYLVKYTITFVPQEIDVSGELKVNDGVVYYDSREEDHIVVKDKKTAKGYVYSVYNDPDLIEDALVEIPDEVWESKEGLDETDLSFNGVSEV